MAVKEALQQFVGKQLTVVMSGLNTTMTGMLVSVNDGWFVMETRVSKQHHFDMSKLNSFYPDEE